MKTSATLAGVIVSLVCAQAFADTSSQATADESLLGEYVVTGTVQEHIPKIAILPSLAPDMEDVTLRGIVRRDVELSGLFDVIPDSKAPPGLYGFDDAVNVDEWRKLGAEAIVKVAARKHDSGKIQVFGLAYFPAVGKDPVYEKKLLVDSADMRVTSHRITDALLGALTGRPGGFASHFVFSGKWGKNRRIFSMDSDGHDLKPLTDPALTAIAPVWGPNETIFYTHSKNYAPFSLVSWDGKTHSPIKTAFKTSIYSVAFNKDGTQMAIAVANRTGSAVYVGNPDGSGMKKVSKTPIATHPAFSPSGKLAWIGGDPNKRGGQRVYVDGKAVSPSGFTAAAPTFCDTEDGIRLVYSVSVYGDKSDIVMSDEKGQGIARLTRNMGTNKYPACSPDGRLIAFFSDRQKKPGIYFLSLKRWRTIKLNAQFGESLRWEALPPAKGAAP
ncbi:MAG: tolB protein [Polyangiaceae bacterium]